LPLNLTKILDQVVLIFTLATYLIAYGLPRGRLNRRCQDVVANKIFTAVPIIFIPQHSSCFMPSFVCL